MVREGKVFFVIQRERGLNIAVIQSLRKQAKNPPKILLSFRGSRRRPKNPLVGSSGGNDDVLLCPYVGDPRCARMTEEDMTLPRPLLGVCPFFGDSTGYCVPL